jgi:tetratricopeptide (TPR) repeat protein
MYGMRFAVPFLTTICLVLLLVASPSLGQGSSYAAAPFQDGLNALRQGNYTAAIALFRKSISFYPQNKAAHHFLALAFVAAGNNEQALKEFRTALNIDSRYVECRDDYGKFLEESGQKLVAQKQFLDCIESNPRYPYAYYHLGQLLQDMGDLDGAIHNYQTAVNLKPDYFEAKRDLGLAMYQKAEPGTMNQAIDKLLDAEKLVPNNPMIHYYLAMIYCDTGKLDEGEAELRSTLSIDAQHAAAHWELARLRYYRGDVDRPLTEIAAAEKISPSYTDGKRYPKPDLIAMHKLQAECQEYGGNITAAIASWSDYASMSKDSPSILKHINALEKESRHNRKNITYSPEQVDSLIKQGESQYNEGNIEGAKESFEKAVQLNPKDYRANQNLGACIEESGELDRALLQYKAAAALNPGFPGAVYNLAYVLEKQGHIAEAAQMYQKFHDMAGKYPYDPKHIVALQQEEMRHPSR